MHPDTHLALHRIRSAELRARADNFRLTHRRAPRGQLRTKLAWTLVETGLRLLPERTVVPYRAPRTA
ncbi:hypothetical protein [Streptomyces sp. NBC_01257]|uniref:hypothetical protein n=1 Tax=Streptomyces sp. NBC_01257 TaxID=2903799 RepID=UPI002DD840D1|nr:hypothetical protein [Streptomyces sp. NBC_01257]WRZ65101.1 hypothetical protein OG408_14940 [Streptomyces sp. NBC_01257]